MPIVGEGIGAGGGKVGLDVGTMATGHTTSVQKAGVTTDAGDVRGSRDGGRKTRGHNPNILLLGVCMARSQYLAPSAGVGGGLH